MSRWWDAQWQSGCSQWQSWQQGWQSQEGWQGGSDRQLATYTHDPDAQAGIDRQGSDDDFFPSTSKARGAYNGLGLSIK